MASESTRSVTPIGLTTIWQESGHIGRVSWGSLAAHVGRSAYENFARSPLTASLTVVTITIALSLLGLFSLIMENARIAVANQGRDVMINIFMQDGVSEAQTVALQHELSSGLPDATVTYRSKAEALAIFREMLGEDQDVLAGLDNDNPLPASFDIVPHDAATAESVHHLLSQKLGNDPRVSSVRFSRSLAAQVGRLLRMLRLGGGIGMFFLLVITGFIIANTIKLALYGHRMEIEIMQLVGAGRSAIFLPYVLEGCLQGLIGAACGLVMVSLLFFVLRDAITKTDVLSFVFPHLVFLSAASVCLTLLAGMFVGMGGSYLAVRRFLSEE